MRIFLVWEDCDLLNYNWVNRTVPSYWVEADSDEVSDILNALERRTPDESSEKTFLVDLQHLRTEIEKNSESEDGKHYFLISRNLESVMSFPHYYPFSGQWNGYSPFRRIEEIQIGNLSEITGITHVLAEDQPVEEYPEESR